MDHLFKCTCPVTHCVFFFEWHFGKCSSVVFRFEDRIVSESLIPSFFIGYVALNRSLEKMLFSMKTECYDRSEASIPVR